MTVIFLLVMLKISSYLLQQRKVYASLQKFTTLFKTKIKNKKGTLLRVLELD